MSPLSRDFTKEGLVDQICPRWNRLQHWFELAEAFRSAAC